MVLELSLIGWWVDGLFGGNRNGSEKCPNTWTGGSSNNTGGTTLGPVFVISLTLTF